VRVRAPIPSLDALTSALASAVGEEVVVLDRGEHRFASTFPGEVVRCRVARRDICVLCKYEAGRLAPVFGHRGGPGYEAMVYREVVTRLPLPAVPFHGAHLDKDTGDTWLFIEFLEGGRRVGDLGAPVGPLRRAARWAARLHTWADRELARLAGAPMRVYDGEYYAQWARRAAAIAGERHRRMPWLRAVCEEAEVVLRELTAVPHTVIHGEFTPNNLLLWRDEVVPVDWETAAIGAGAVDLASLTDKWPPAVVRACESEYARSRWPEGPPPDHRRTLDLARTYWELRWLGDRPEWLDQPRMVRRYADLRTTAARLGLGGIS
jgi:hypothetical protein